MEQLDLVKAFAPLEYLKEKYMKPEVSDRIFVGKSTCLICFPDTLQCMRVCSRCDKGTFTATQIKAILEHYSHNPNVRYFAVL